MKLHTVFVTYNRLELTRQAIASYVDTVTCPFHFTVVDNGSTDGTEEWLRENIHSPGAFILLGKNFYPGKAMNIGWSASLPDVTHLHRADNDFIFLSGWCEEVERCFEENENLGQLGLRIGEEEGFNKINVGGNCVISRNLWDLGLRWDERTWPQIRDQVGNGWTEDSLMSKAVKRTHIPGTGKSFYEWDRVAHPCIQSISYESMDDWYYRQSWEDRGITESRDVNRLS